MVDEQEIERAVERARRAAEAVKRAQADLAREVRGLSDEVEAHRRAQADRQPADHP